ncbi:RNA-binding domain-containing protein [Gordonibacter urolithinfaciens]|uniref:AAA family ATPase n=1 Tax=Gordonibacter urolithinfaciens TaxID=1335613 RepID=A0A6N8II49_9ACTN|nr:RNA-binding domain-containing protein [Gordonibacter urolithinfaciens]MVM53342.1 AAA family ATPase [Gordonibacter urolithinfaciens]MVN15505.1 AAA family ATPase [Gordonibacter urolithinfaciens]MVN37448.1 AAA family ATPase [Gordonibacter urolithinfaciens]MVN55477.1 AAA family ATPase [Gordonibacter urolithinfaciens]MVN60070.1 AAA family ATPase [Gordonibacter urolithinfaciens]
MDIPLKESLTVEFKSDTSGNAAKHGIDEDILVNATVAMFNSEGGVLYLGVEDDGKPTGLNPKHADPIGLSAFLANKTMPPIRVEAELVSVSGVDVLRIIIPKGNVVGATSDGRILKRVMRVDGTPENIPMYPFEIATRLGNLGKLDFSNEAVSDATMDDFDPVEVERLRRLIGSLPDSDKTLLDLEDKELFLALGLVRMFDDQAYPTVAGLLLVGRETALTRHVPTAKSSFQVLEGTEVRLNVETSLPLLAVFEKFEQYFSAQNPSREVDRGLFRLSIADYDKRAFREALVNAFAHRDYTILRPTRVLMDSEGMTISNPGGFVEGITYENLLTVPPHGRNPLLAEALKRVGLAEKTGRGVDRIYEGSLRFGRPLPDYSASTSNDVVLFTPRAPFDAAFTTMIFEEERQSGKLFTVFALMVLSVVRDERKVTFGALRDETRIDQGRLHRVLGDLIERGLIESHGSGKATSYLLSARVYKETGNALGYVHQKGIDEVRHRELVMELARVQGSLKRSDVAALLHVSLSKASQILKDLVGAGKLQLEGHGRGARYYPAVQD